MTDIRVGFVSGPGAFPRRKQLAEIGDPKREEKGCSRPPRGRRQRLRAEFQRGSVVRSRRATPVKLIDVRPVESDGSLFPARATPCPIPSSQFSALSSPDLSDWISRRWKMHSTDSLRESPLPLPPCAPFRVPYTTDRCTVGITSVWKSNNDATVREI